MGSSGVRRGRSAVAQLLMLLLLALAGAWEGREKGLREVPCGRTEPLSTRRALLSPMYWSGAAHRMRVGRSPAPFTPGRDGGSSGSLFTKLHVSSLAFLPRSVLKSPSHEGSLPPSSRDACGSGGRLTVSARRPLCGFTSGPLTLLCLTIDVCSGGLRRASCVVRVPPPFSPRDLSFSPPPTHHP